MCTSFSANCLCSYLLPTLLLSWLSFASLVWVATFGNGGHWPFSAAGINCVCWVFTGCSLPLPAMPHAVSRTQQGLSQAVLGKWLNKVAEFLWGLLMEVGEFRNVLKKRGTQDWGLGWAKLCKHQPKRQNGEVVAISYGVPVLASPMPRMLPTCTILFTSCSSPGR